MTPSNPGGGGGRVQQSLTDGASGGSPVEWGMSHFFKAIQFFSKSILASNISRPGEIPELGSVKALVNKNCESITCIWI